MTSDRKRKRGKWSWGHSVAAVLVVVVVLGAVLSGGGDGDAPGGVTLRTVPTPASTVTPTMGWWGDVEVSPLPTATPGMEEGR